MRKPCLLAVGCLFISLLGTSALATTQTQQTREISIFAPLRNQDIVLLVERKLGVEAIVTLIKVSPCNFDIFPPVMQDLKRRGVPEPILEAMADAPYGPPGGRKIYNSGHPIYHYAELLKQKGFLPGSEVRPYDPSTAFSADRRKAGGILRR